MRKYRCAGGTDGRCYHCLTDVDCPFGFECSFQGGCVEKEGKPGSEYCLKWGSDKKAIVDASGNITTTECPGGCYEVDGEIICNPCGPDLPRKCDGNVAVMCSDAVQVADLVESKGFFHDSWNDAFIAVSYEWGTTVDCELSGKFCEDGQCVD